MGYVARKLQLFEPLGATILVLMRSSYPGAGPNDYKIIEVREGVGRWGATIDVAKSGSVWRSDARLLRHTLRSRISIRLLDLFGSV